MKTSQRILIIIFTVVLVSASILYWGLNSRGLTERLVPPIANIFLKDIRITQLSLDQQRFNINGSFSFDSVIIKVSDKAGEMGVALDQLRITSIYDLLRLDRPIEITLRDGTFMGADLVINAIEFNGVLVQRSKNNYEIDGNISISKAIAQKLIVSNITGQIEGMLPNIAITNIIADCYGGKVHGSVLCQPEDDGYVNLSLNLDSVDISKIANDRPDLVSQVDGIADIYLMMQSHNSAITDFKADLTMTEKSRVNAALMQFLIDYIPNSAERKELALLIKEKKKIALDKAIVKVTDFDSEKISLAVQLASKRINLDLNLTLDLIVEGGLMNLLVLTDKNRQTK
jgi:hypothetical protein